MTSRWSSSLPSEKESGPVVTSEDTTGSEEKVHSPPFLPHTPPGGHCPDQGQLGSTFSAMPSQDRPHSLEIVGACPSLLCPAVSSPPLLVEGDRSLSDRGDGVCLVSICCPGTTVDNASYPLKSVPVWRVSDRIYATLSISCNSAFTEVYLGIFECGY